MLKKRKNKKKEKKPNHRPSSLPIAPHYHAAALPPTLPLISLHNSLPTHHPMPKTLAPEVAT